MKKVKILVLIFMYVSTNIISQNTVYVETNINSSCKEGIGKLDSIMQIFAEQYKSEFSSHPYSGTKKIENVFLEKTEFFEDQLGIKKIHNYCCSKFSSIYSKIIVSGNTIKMNCTVFEYSFNNPNDVAEIKLALERYNKKFFVSNTPYYFKYFTNKYNIYIVSTSSGTNYNSEVSLFNQFYNCLKKSH